VKARVASGIGLALAYVVVWGGTAWQLNRPLPWFDGLLPPAAYNWINPPPEMRKTNLPPSSGQAAIGQRDSVFEPGFISTDDGQASLSFVPGTFPPHSADREIRFTITPLGSASGLPADLTVRSNFYRFTASYSPSGAPVMPPLSQAPLVTLRYAQHNAQASIYVSATGQAPWKRLDCAIQAVIQQVVCRTPTLGWFVVANPAVKPTFSLPPWLLIGIAALVLALALGMAVRPSRRSSV
jgi:hypothetical protein